MLSIHHRNLSFDFLEIGKSKRKFGWVLYLPMAQSLLPKSGHFLIHSPVGINMSSYDKRNKGKEYYSLYEGDKVIYEAGALMA